MRSTTNLIIISATAFVLGIIFNEIAHSVFDSNVDHIGWRHLIEFHIQEISDHGDSRIKGFHDDILRMWVAYNSSTTNLSEDIVRNAMFVSGNLNFFSPTRGLPVDDFCRNYLTTVGVPESYASSFVDIYWASEVESFSNLTSVQ